MAPRRPTKSALNPVCCALCPKTFNQSGLVPHMRKSHSDELHECEHCTEFFLKNEDLQSHVESEHQNIGAKKRPQRVRKVPAKIADLQNVSPKKGTKRAASPDRQKAKMSKEDPKTAADIDDEEEPSDGKNSDGSPKCPLCDFEASDFQSLTVHMMVHLTPGKTSFPCDQCTGEFTNEEDLLKHKAVHDEQQRSVVIVDPNVKRGQRTGGQASVQPPLKMPSIVQPKKRAVPAGRKRPTNRRAVPKELICTLCQRAFGSVALFNEHRLSVHGSPVTVTQEGSLEATTPKAVSIERVVEQYNCEVCGMAFLNRDGLNDHKQKQHGLRLDEESNFEGSNEIDQIQLQESTDQVNDNTEAHGSEEASTSAQTNEQENSTEEQSNLEDLTCKICSQVFATAVDLTAHSKMNHTIIHVAEDGTFRCGNNCPDLFNSLDDLERHIQFCEGLATETSSMGNTPATEESNENAKRYSCQECDIQFLNLRALRLHQKRHDSFRCSLCQAVFDSKTELAKHESSEHNIASIFFCEYCGMVSESEERLKEHISETHQSNEHQCPHCDVTFPDAETCGAHLLTAHKSKDRFECQECGKRFPYRARLRVHERIHTGELKFQCEVCNDRFVHGNTYRNHMRRHRGEQPLYAANKKTTAPCLCETCGKSYQNPKALQIHERVHDDQQIRCEFCPKKFKNVFYLKNHMKIHTTAPHLKCSHCNKTFRTSTTLHEHIVSHTGEKPYHCQMCGFETGTMSRLKKHQKSRHFEVKYTCPDCSMQLTTYQGLLRHYLSHTKEFPYKCSHCHKLFYVDANARRHVDFHMKKGIEAAVVDNLPSVYTCKECGKELRTFANLVVHLYLTHKFTREQFPELPLNLQENRDFLHPEEVDSPLYTAVEKSDRGRPLVQRPKHQFVTERAQIVEEAVEVPLAQISHIVEQSVEDGMQDFPVTILSADGTLDVAATVQLPANLDGDALAMAVSQLMAMQASNERGEVTISLQS